MSNYYCKSTYEIKEIPQELYNAWVSSQNPKAQAYALLPEKPSENAVWESGEWIIPETSVE